MADFPSLPLWTDAYLADTRHLTTLEHGAYFLLLMEAWRRPTCSLPDDDVMLARLAGLNRKDWTEAKPIIMAFWKLDRRSKTWTQKRLSKEHVYVRDRRKSQSDRAAKRWKREKKDDAAALPDECPPNALSTPTPTPLIPLANANGPAPPDGPEIDVGKAADDHLWRAGKSFLISCGVGKTRAGSVLGKWKGKHGTASVLEALGVAQREPDLVEPIPFIEKVLQRRADDGGGGHFSIGGVRMNSPC